MVLRLDRLRLVKRSSNSHRRCHCRWIRGRRRRQRRRRRRRLHRHRRRRRPLVGARTPASRGCRAGRDCQACSLNRAPAWARAGARVAAACARPSADAGPGRAGSVLRPMLAAAAPQRRATTRTSRTERAAARNRAVRHVARLYRLVW